MEGEAQTPAQPALQPSQKFAPRFWFMMISGRLEAFGASIFNSVMTMFLFNKLRFTTNDLLYIQTVFGSVVNFSAPIGGVIADVIRNKFYLVLTQRMTKCCFALAWLLLTCPQFRQNTHQIWSILYVAYTIEIIGIIVASTGFSAFIIDQFKLPQEQLILRKYVQWREILSNTVEIFGFVISPVIKSRIPCFGEQDCYFIPVTIYVIFQIISAIISCAGYKTYIIKKPEIRRVTKVFPCLAHGLVQWIRNRKTNPLPHWLDHAVPVYGIQMVEEAKAMLRILLFNANAPIVGAASMVIAMKLSIVNVRLKLRLGSYKMMPEHLALLSPIINIILRPLLMRFVEPRLRGSKMDKTFRWIIFGQLLGVLGMICYSFLVRPIELNFPVVPGLNEAQLRIYNSAECPCTIKTSIFFNETLTVDPQGEILMNHVPITGYKTYHLTIEGTCFETQHAQSYLESGKAISIWLKSSENKLNVVTYYETVSRTKETSLPYLIIIGAEVTDRIVIEDSRGHQMDILPKKTLVAGQLVVSNNPREIEVIPSWYTLYVNERTVAEFETDLGGIYKIALLGNKTKLSLIAQPNVVHFLWLIPIIVLDVISQFFVLIGSTEYSFMETPPSLRGITISLTSIVNGFGKLMIPLFKTDYRLDYQLYVFSLIFLFNIAYNIFFAFHVKSMHPGRKLI